MHVASQVHVNASLEKPAAVAVSSAKTIDCIIMVVEILIWFHKIYEQDWKEVQMDTAP